MKRLDVLAEMLTKETGIKHSFSGSNGMYYCSDFSPFSYLNGAHYAKDVCLYIEGLLTGLKFNKH